MARDWSTPLFVGVSLKSQSYIDGILGVGGGGGARACGVGGRGGRGGGGGGGGAIPGVVLLSVEQKQSPQSAFIVQLKKCICSKTYQQLQTLGTCMYSKHVDVTNGYKYSTRHSLANLGLLLTVINSPGTSLKFGL